MPALSGNAQVCWGTADDTNGGCFTSDTVAAVEDAIKDGVDIISYSISGDGNSFRDAMGVAFMNAGACVLARVCVCVCVRLSKRRRAR
jgi:hypothetical protein